MMLALILNMDCWNWCWKVEEEMNECWWYFGVGSDAGLYTTASRRLHKSHNVWLRLILWSLERSARSFSPRHFLYTSFECTVHLETQGVAQGLCESGPLGSTTHFLASHLDDLGHSRKHSNFPATLRISWCILLPWSRANISKFAFPVFLYAGHPAAAKWWCSLCHLAKICKRREPPANQRIAEKAETPSKSRKVRGLQLSASSYIVFLLGLKLACSLAHGEVHFCGTCRLWLSQLLWAL